MFTVAPSNAFALEPLPNGALLGTVTNPSLLPWGGMAKTSQGSLALYCPTLASFYATLHTKFPTPQKTGSSSALSNDGGWRHFRSYEEALDTYEHHPERVRQFTVKEDDLQSMMEQGATMTHDVVGDVFDVGLYLEGDPECWGTLSYGNPRGLYAYILVNMSTSGYIRGEHVVHRNQRLVRLVDWLEQNRIRTRIHIARLNSQNVTEIRLKDYHDPFDVNALAAATHLDFYRRLLFRVNEYSNTHASNYGIPATIFQGALKEPPMGIESGLISIYSEIQDSKEKIDQQFDEAESYIAATYNDAFTGEDYGRSHDHHDPATGLPGGGDTTKLVWS